MNLSIFPLEIRDMIYKNLVNISKKDFKHDIRQGWFDLYRKRMEKMKTKKSQHQVFLDVEQWMYDVDNLPNIEENELVEFHHRIMIFLIQYDPLYATRWMFCIIDSTQEDLQYISEHVANNYVKCCESRDDISPNPFLVGYVLLSQEVSAKDVKTILGRHYGLIPCGLPTLDAYDNYLDNLDGTVLQFGNSQLRSEIYLTKRVMQQTSKYWSH